MCVCVCTYIYIPTYTLFDICNSICEKKNLVEILHIMDDVFTSFFLKLSILAANCSLLIFIDHVSVTWMSEYNQSCPTLCNPMDCSLPGFSVHGIFQARVLVWVAISFSRGSSWPRDQTQVSCIAGRCFTLWATREAQKKYGRKSSVNTF